MANEKRERQRQNRAVKQAELDKQKRKQRVIDTTKRVGKWIVVGVVLIVLSNVVWG